MRSRDVRFRPCGSFETLQAFCSAWGKQKKVRTPVDERTSPVCRGRNATLLTFDASAARGFQDARVFALGVSFLPTVGGGWIVFLLQANRTAFSVSLLLVVLGLCISLLWSFSYCLGSELLTQRFCVCHQFRNLPAPALWALRRFRLGVWYTARSVPRSS